MTSEPRPTALACQRDLREACLLTLTCQFLGWSNTGVKDFCGKGGSPFQKDLPRAGSAAELEFWDNKMA